jgi:hypothetical protein
MSADSIGDEPSLVWTAKLQKRAVEPPFREGYNNIHHVNIFLNILTRCRDGGIWRNVKW